jgi:hypothetical protein
LLLPFYVVVKATLLDEDQIDYVSIAYLFPRNTQSLPEFEKGIG